MKFFLYLLSLYPKVSTKIFIRLWNTKQAMTMVVCWIVANVHNVVPLGAWVQSKYQLNLSTFTLSTSKLNCLYYGLSVKLY
jgi:hypothetical protein